jgi:hypothetical protein
VQIDERVEIMSTKKGVFGFAASSSPNNISPKTEKEEEAKTPSLGMNHD